MMKSMNKLGLYVPPAMRSAKDIDAEAATETTNHQPVPPKTEKKVGFAIPPPRLEVYKSSDRENQYPPGFGPTAVDKEVQRSALLKEVPAPKVAPLAAICRNAAVAGRKRNMADTAIPAPSTAAENGKGSSGGARRGSRSGRKRNMADTAIPAPSAAAAENGKGSSGGARRGSRSRGGRGRSGAPAGRTVTVVIPKASAGPRWRAANEGSVRVTGDMREGGMQ